MKTPTAEITTPLPDKATDGRIPIIEMKAVEVRFGGKTILEDFCLQLFAGEKLVVTGESGLGKSTILRCILGFVIPTEGQIFIQAKPLTAGSVWNLRKLLAYVPQEPELGNGTLQDWLANPFSFRANTALKKNLQRLPGLLEHFGLSADLLHKEVSALSGGEKQRAALIAAILLQRKIFLLDEPTSALDSKNAQRILEFLFAIPDASILAVSHDPAFLELADRTIAISAKGANHAN